MKRVIRRAVDRLAVARDRVAPPQPARYVSQVPASASTELSSSASRFRRPHREAVADGTLSDDGGPSSSASLDADLDALLSAAHPLDESIADLLDDDLSPVSGSVADMLSSPDLSNDDAIFSSF